MGEYSGQRDKVKETKWLHRDIFPSRRIDWQERKVGMSMELWRQNLQMAALFGSNIAIILLASLL